MASNYNRRSNSSASNQRRSSRNSGGSYAGSGQSRPRAGSSLQGSRPSSRRSSPNVSSSAFTAQSNRPAPSRQRAASRMPSQGYGAQNAYPGMSSVRVGDIPRIDRAGRAHKRYRRYVIRIAIVLGLIIALLVAGIALYYSSLFTITSVSVKGVEHLTAEDMASLASVPEGTTLLRVDAAGIKGRLQGEAWVKDVDVNRVFPNTLELAITERTIAATVEVPIENAQTTETWAIASDGMWLMPIPRAGSEESLSVSSKVYEDAENVLHITEVPYGVVPEIGGYCSDENVNNALSVVDGLTTELADQVKTVSASGTETTTLVLENGIEIAFGTADNIREKERVCLQLIADNPDKIAYINVRVVERPTWRSI